MVLGWMVYTLCVTGLLGLGGRLLDAALRSVGRPARRVWVATVAASLLVPGGSYLAFSLSSPVPTVRPPDRLGHAVHEMTLRVESVADPSVWKAVDDALLVVWPTGSGLLLIGLVGAGMGLARARRAWKRRRVGGRTVLVSDTVGPAVVGVFRPEIVVPREILEREREVLDWVLAHEDQHIRARDPVTLAFGLLVAVLLPWNLALWWHLARLRLAVEIDCDLRVLSGRDRRARRSYGSALLRFGGRRAVPFHALPAFTERSSSLERRIRFMSGTTPAHPVRRASALIAGGSLLVAAACLAPGPDRIVSPEAGEGSPEPQPVAVQVGRAPDAALGDEPTFTPYEVPPELLNREEVMRGMQLAYPPLLRDAGIGGVVKVHLFIAETGGLSDVRLDRSSGHEPLDRAALEVARLMRFEPARNGGEAVPVWISQDITFTSAPAGGPEPETRGATPEPEPEASPPAPDETRGDVEFTPYDTPPQLLNPRETQRALQSEYPPLLRDVGIGGAVRVHIFIDATGTRQDALIAASSGHAALDAAALEVTKVMRFIPAKLRGEAVPVWISQEITFSVR